MAENKTKATEASVDGYIAAIGDESRRKDCETLAKLMANATKQKPKMWGASIVGFGSYHYKYESGREGDMIMAGFSPRKQNLTIYNMGGNEQFGDLLQKLGKHTLGGGCLYIKRLDDVDLPTLKNLMEASFKQAQHKAD